MSRPSGALRGELRVGISPVTPKTGPGGPRAARSHVGTSFVRILVQLTQNPPPKAPEGRDIDHRLARQLELRFVLLVPHGVYM